MKQADVLNGLTTLMKDDVKSILVLGTFGSSVSSTSRGILEKYAKHKKWKPFQYRYDSLPGEIDEERVLFVYGWFGYWNDDLCSSDNVEKACNFLRSTLANRKNVKVIIGMRSDIYKKYTQIFDKYSELLHPHISLDRTDILRDAEHLKSFNQIKSSCKKKKCECKILTFDMLRKGKDKVVGMPLKISIMNSYHELVSDYINDWDVLKVMSTHFGNLDKNEKTKNVSKWIKYICLKGQYFKSLPFDEDLLSGIDTSSNDLNTSFVEVQQYLRKRNLETTDNVSEDKENYVFWHPFIYICAFHSMFQNDPELVMKYCNVDAILQLVRPPTYTKTYYEIHTDEHSAGQFYDRLMNQELLEKYKNHPLVQMIQAKNDIPSVPC